MSGKIKSIIKTISFSCIVIFLLFSLTYLLRDNQFSYADRISVCGIKEEKMNSIDAVFIGGSATFVYWEPYKAFKNHGFTSYCLATNTLQAEAIKHYVIHCEMYQHPKLYVIGLRPFQYFENNGNEIGLRISTDAMDIGNNRNELISEYITNRKIETDILSLYFDLIKYHTNYKAFFNQQAWQLINNSIYDINKGCQIQALWAKMKKPSDFKSNNKTELANNCKKVLISLCDYLKKLDTNVLFVVCPYVINKEQYEIYNSLRDIVLGYGFDYINCNDYYDEMNIDFSRDFYNEDHVNVFGAEKYTDFLSNYINIKYNMPNHYSDPMYADWHEGLERFEKFSDNYKSDVINKMSTTIDK